MTEMGFLERLRKMEQEPDRRGKRDAGEIVDSINTHLMKILNTRQGTVLLDPEFGLPDYTNFGASFSVETVEELKQCMEKLVRRYEPRLQNVRVTPRPMVPGSLELAFDLDGLIAFDDMTIPVKMFSSIGHSGEVLVRPR